MNTCKTIELDGRPGEHINDYIGRCYELAKRGTIVEGEFNGIKFNTAECNSVDELVEHVRLKMHEAQAAYEQSDEYKNSQCERAKKIKQKQETATKLMSELEAIDWNSFNDILTWLSSIQPVADHSGVSIDTGKVIETFRKNGFFPNVNLGDDFNKNDPENVARYIIGQALDGFKIVGAPHPVLLTFVADWKRNQFATMFNTKLQPS